MLLLLIGCPAERLGVEMPAGGVDTISAEDLQRDAYALTRPDADPGAVFARRLAQMHLPPVESGAGDEEGRVCARRGGEGPARVVVAPWPIGGPTLYEDAARAAVLISIAKGWDSQPPSRRTTWLCMAKAGAPLPEGAPVPLDVAVTADRLEAIDYRRLRDDTQAFFRTLEP